MVDLNPSELKKDNNLILKHDCLFISIRDRYATRNCAHANRSLPYMQHLMFATLLVVIVSAAPTP